MRGQDATLVMVHSGRVRERERELFTDPKDVLHFLNMRFLASSHNTC
jgi:hypothetical protein